MTGARRGRHDRGSFHPLGHNGGAAAPPRPRSPLRAVFVGLAGGALFERGLPVALGAGGHPQPAPTLCYRGAAASPPVGLSPAGGPLSSF